MRVGNVLDDPTQRECDAAVGWHALIPCPWPTEKSRRRASRRCAGTTVMIRVARYAADGRGQAASREPVEATCNDTPRLARDARSSFLSYGEGVAVGVAVASWL